MKRYSHEDERQRDCAFKATSVCLYECVHPADRQEPIFRNDSLGRANAFNLFRSVNVRIRLSIAMHGKATGFHGEVYKTT